LPASARQRVVSALKTVPLRFGNLLILTLLSLSLVSFFRALPRIASTAMKIGMTYDLREDYLAQGFDEQAVAEFDKPETIEAIESALEALGHEVDRIGHARALLSRLHEGDRWDLVFNIAEGLSSAGISREAQVPTILDLYGIPYTFSDPLVCSLTLHKGVTKRIVRDLGIPTAAFAIVEREADADVVELAFPLFAKPVAEGSSKGVTGQSRILGREQLRQVCRSLLAQYQQPVLVERYLPGREFTVGIVGTGERARSIAALEVNLLAGAEAGVYSYHNKENWREVVRYAIADGPVAQDACELALAAYRGLNCRDAGRVDVRADEYGTLNFIEINPLAGLNPNHSDLPILASRAGMPFGELIRCIIESASERLPRAAGGCACCRSRAREHAR
jgi:D-alanine-D-alanine ligase